ncbi:Taste receptor type 2 member 140 [Lemmus lemmus]
MGNLGNAFTVLVNIMDLVKRRRISLIDQILTTLAVSRISLLFSLTASLFVSERFPAKRITRRIVKQTCISWTVTNHFSVWLATCLSIFYFLKIANFSNSIFLHLKWRVKKMVSGTLLASLFLLFLNILVINTHIDVFIYSIEANASFSVISSNYSQVSRLILLTNTMFTLIPFTVTVLLVNTMFTLTPFTVSLTLFLLLIFSLWRHLKSMQHKAKGFRDVSTTAQIKALHTVVTFLLLYMIFFLSLLSLCWKANFNHRSLTVLFLQIMGIAFPSVHSCALILENRKLSQSLLSVLWWMRCRLKDTKWSFP